MKNIMVTGATGAIGQRTIIHLLKKGLPAEGIFGLARGGRTVPELEGTGIEMRSGDYADFDSLLHAFKGIDRLMLTSAVAFSDRFTQHYNVISAARQAGVKHVVYMSVMRKANSGLVMPEVTESDIFTEQLLRASGLDYTIVFHPPFLDVLPLYYGTDYAQNGIHIPSVDGKMSPALRDELAEAHAEILSSDGHRMKTYALGGSESISFSDIARMLSEQAGMPVPFSKITPEEYIVKQAEKGMPAQLAEFLTGWFHAIDQGIFEDHSGDLERLLGRKSTTFSAYINTADE